VATTTYSPDDAGRTTNIKTVNASGSVLANYTYTYDAANELLTKVESGTTTSYAYDSAGQLTQDGTATFTYDADGNRNMTGYSTSTGNRTAMDGTWAYTYDAAGDVIKKSKGIMFDTWVYTYDNNNEMLTATESATDGGAATQRVTFAYDALGNRISSQEWNGSTTTTTRYGLDGWDTAQPAPTGNENYNAWVDLNGSNAVTTRRMFGADFGAPKASETSAGAVSWNALDQVGSVRVVFDNTGTITSTLSYDAFGKLTSGTVPDRYAYAGMQRDSITGLQSAGNGTRDYSADDGKWLQVVDRGFKRAIFAV
jgi:YD repeat-containing protein